MESFNAVEILKSLLLPAIFTFWLYWLWTRRDFYRFAFKFPGFFGVPLLGMVNRFKSFNYATPALSKMLKECNAQSICIWLGLYPVLFTIDCDLIQEVLTSPEMVNKALPLYRPVTRRLKNGLFASSATKWQHNRKMINPSFQHKVLLSLFPLFHKATNVTIAKFNALADDRDREHKLTEMLHRITLSLTVETTMGKQMKEGDQVDEALIKTFSYILKRLAIECMWCFINLDGLIAFLNEAKESRVNVFNFVKELIQHKFNRMNETSNTDAPQKPSDEVFTRSSSISMKKEPKIFIDQAIKIYQEQQFTIEDIINESNTIVAASFETTANGIFSTLTMLAMHPPIQERLFEEISNIFPEKNFEMDYEHMQQLPYLDMVINETLRIAPSVLLIGRHCMKDMQFGKELLVPKGMQIFISIFDLHRRTDIWGPNAHKFDPDNFLPENFANKHPYAYIPFSKGLRNCIGWRYALMALKSMLAGLVRNFRFTTEMKFEDLKYVNHVTMRYLQEPVFKIYRRD